MHLQLHHEKAKLHIPFSKNCMFTCKMHKHENKILFETLHSKCLFSVELRETSIFVQIKTCIFLIVNDLAPIFDNHSNLKVFIV